MLRKTKVNFCHLGLVLDVLFRKWIPFSEVPSPRTTTSFEHVSLINQKQQVDQEHEISPKIVTREQFLEEPN
jgi:hypothetical protein